MARQFVYGHNVVTRVGPFTRIAQSGVVGSEPATPTGAVADPKTHHTTHGLHFVDPTPQLRRITEDARVGGSRTRSKRRSTASDDLAVLEPGAATLAQVGNGPEKRGENDVPALSHGRPAQRRAHPSVTAEIAEPCPSDPPALGTGPSHTHADHDTSRSDRRSTWCRRARATRSRVGCPSRVWLRRDHPTSVGVWPSTGDVGGWVASRPGRALRRVPCAPRWVPTASGRRDEQQLTTVKLLCPAVRGRIAGAASPLGLSRPQPSWRRGDTGGVSEGPTRRAHGWP